MTTPPTSHKPALRKIVAVISLAACLCTGREATAQPAPEWSSWRGPLHTGASPDGDPPVTWREESGVRWKLALPGRGSGTPIVSSTTL